MKFSYVAAVRVPIKTVETGTPKKSNKKISYDIQDVRNHLDIIQISSMVLQQKKVYIYVSGKKYETFESTLANFPNTLLGNINKRLDYYEESTDSYAFARCVYSFDAILFYYQSKGILAKPSYVAREKFYKELEFYEINEYIDERHCDDIAFMEKYINNNIPLPKERRCENIFKSIQFKNENIKEYLYTSFHLLVTLLSISTYCLETEPSMKSYKVWLYFEIIITVCFSLELFLIAFSSPNFKKYCLTSIGFVDISSIISCISFLILSKYSVQDNFDDFIRFSRVLRLFKLTKYSTGFRLFLYTIVRCSENLQILFVLLIFCFAYAAAIFKLENQFNNDNSQNKFQSILDACWYSIMTATGVGYGDIYPTTSFGKLVGSCLALTGLLLFCLPQPMLVNQFISVYYLPETLSEENTIRKRAIVKMREDCLEKN